MGLAEASIGLRVTFQYPDLSAFALCDCPAMETETVSPAWAHPQIGFLCFCWRTMFSPMTDGVRNSANAMLERKISAREKRDAGFMRFFRVTRVGGFGG